MNKLVLDFEYDFDFTLFGISSHVANYRLAWGVNKFLDIDLERMDDVDLSFGKEKKRNFSFHRFDDEESYTTIHLVSNRSSNGYLIPELKQMDYFLQYWGPMSAEELTAMNDNIRKISSVLTAVQVDPMDLKSRNNLLF